MSTNAKILMSNANPVRQAQASPRKKSALQNPIITFRTTEEKKKIKRKSTALL
jgi:hypothetical protein